MFVLIVGCGRVGSAIANSMLAAEAPSRVRGGGRLGGRGLPRERAAGDTTRYVLEKAPCRVILTAPPAGEEGERRGVRP